jgi:hypothetical protein
LIYVCDMDSMRLAIVCAWALRIDLVLVFVLVMVQCTLAVEEGFWWLWTTTTATTEIRAKIDAPVSSAVLKVLLHCRETSGG